MGADPVASGIVARLDRPSGNITGFATLEPTLAGKWLELLLEIAPGLKRVAIMFNPDASPASLLPSLETAARSKRLSSPLGAGHLWAFHARMSHATSTANTTISSSRKATESTARLRAKARARR
jgi:hypothetical protein